MNQDAKSLIKEARKRVIEGCDKERYLFEPEYHAWITQCANAAEMGVRLASERLADPWPIPLPAPTNEAVGER